MDNTLLHNKGQMVGKDRWRQRINGSQRYGSKRSLAIKGSWQQRDEFNDSQRYGSKRSLATKGSWQQRDEVNDSQRYGSRRSLAIKGSWQQRDEVNDSKGPMREKGVGAHIVKLSQNVKNNAKSKKITQFVIYVSREKRLKT